MGPQVVHLCEYINRIFSHANKYYGGKVTHDVLVWFSADFVDVERR